MSLALPLAAEPTVHLTPQARLLAAAIAIVFMVMILELIRRHRLQERYSVIWFVAGLGMLAGAAFPGLLEVVADVMGVRDTNVALFSLVLLLLLGLALNFSVIVSRQGDQITRLAQERALSRRLSRLSAREREVLELLAEGMRAAAIAEHFVVSMPTVRTQIRSILAKLDVSSQLEAVALFRQQSETVEWSGRRVTSQHRHK